MGGPSEVLGFMSAFPDLTIGCPRHKVAEGCHSEQKPDFRGKVARQCVSVMHLGKAGLKKLPAGERSPEKPPWHLLGPGGAKGGAGGAGPVAECPERLSHHVPAGRLPGPLCSGSDLA